MRLLNDHFCHDSAASMHMEAFVSTKSFRERFELYLI